MKFGKQNALSPVLGGTRVSHADPTHRGAMWVFFFQMSSMVTLKTWKQGTCTRKNQAQSLRYDFFCGLLPTTGP